MKKVGVLAVVLFALVLASSFVGAATVAENVDTFLDDAVNVINPVAKVLLGETPTGELLFAKVLFFIIILSIVWVAASKFEPLSGTTWALVLVSVAVSVLAVRFITSVEWIQAMILPYNAFAIALVSFVPLLIYFYFVEKFVPKRSMRKIAWILAAVVFFGLFISRSADKTLGDYNNFMGGITPAYVYLFTAILCLILMFADKSIQNAFRKSQQQDLEELHQAETRATIRKARAELEKGLLDGSVTQAEYALRDPILEAKEKKHGIK